MFPVQLRLSISEVSSRICAGGGEKEEENEEEQEQEEESGNDKNDGDLGIQTQSSSHAEPQRDVVGEGVRG